VAGASRLWCTTCGAYVVPGTHGIHASVYGRGASVASETAPQVSGLRAVAIVVASLAAVTVVGFAFVWAAYVAGR
jgi:hypothetical protein